MTDTTFMGQSWSGPDGTFRRFPNGDGTETIQRLVGDCISDDEDWVDVAVSYGERDADFRSDQSVDDWKRRMNDVLSKAIAPIVRDDVPTIGGDGIMRWTPLREGMEND